MKVTAYIPALNEVDILPWIVRRWQSQGVQAYVLDGWSTDGTWEALPSLGLVGFERLPAGGPLAENNHVLTLTRIQELAASRGDDWCYYTDADEIRISPRRGESVVQAIQRADDAGYNAIDHKVYVFHPTDEGYHGDPERYLRYFTATDDMACRLPQVKLWKNTGRTVNLLKSGGHSVDFPGKRISPEKFILKHYPFRSSAHGRARVAARLKRISQSERQKFGWSVHYDQYSQTQSYVRDPTTLTFWRDIEHPEP